MAFQKGKGERGGIAVVMPYSTIHLFLFCCVFLLCDIQIDYDDYYELKICGVYFLRHYHLNIFIYYKFASSFQYDTRN